MASSSRSSNLPSRVTILFCILILSPILFMMQRKSLEQWDFFSGWKSAVMDTIYSPNSTGSLRSSRGANNNNTLPSATTAPVTKPTSKTSFHINLSPLLKLQADFYQTHFRWMQQLFGDNPTINNTNLMIWGTRNDREFDLLYNEFGSDFYDARDQEKVELRGRHYVLFSDPCDAARFFKEHGRTPHVPFFVLNENWGAWSEAVPNKTTDWVANLTQHWIEWGCSVQDMRDYLDHPDTLLAVTTQFQIWDHPKLLSLPLGLKNELEAVDLIQHALEPNPLRFNRTQLLMVNCHGGPTRDAALAVVEQNTGVRNTFVWGWGDKNEYYREMQRSKFILTPGGFGFDCYRIWEAIIMGTIPVIETLNRTDGWFRSFEHLPVALVDAYENLTPEWLEAEYPKIIGKEMDYRRLTKPYWVQFIKSHLEALSS